MAWLGREEGTDWRDWGLGVRKWVSPSVPSLGLELELCSTCPFPHPPTSGTRVCLLLLCAGVLQGRPREGSLIGVVWVGTRGLSSISKQVPLALYAMELAVNRK